MGRKEGIICALCPIRINNLFSRADRPKGNQFKLYQGRCQLRIIEGGLHGEGGFIPFFLLCSIVLKLFPPAGPAAEDVNGL